MGSSTIRIAWRGLGRNRKRTFLAVSAIALGQFMIVFMSCMIAGMNEEMLDDLTGPLVGHVQIHNEEWREERAIDLYIDGIAEITAQIEAIPEVRKVSPRVFSAVLAASGERADTPADAEPAMIVGVDVDVESREGGILEGLPADQLPGDGEVVLGKVLARRMGAEVGQLVAVIGMDADEFPISELFRVCAVMQGKADMVNSLGMVIALSTAQAFLALPDQAHEILVHGTDARDAEALAARISEIPQLAGTSVLPWREAMPQLVRIIDIRSFGDILFVIIIFIAAAAGIANTMMMTTFERTHEFGMLLALGSHPRRIVRMIVFEAVALTLTGVAIGTVFGSAVVLLTSHTGLDFGALADMGDDDVAFSGLIISYVFYPKFVFRPIYFGIAAALVTSVLASSWPASLIAQLEPMEAMRGQQGAGGGRRRKAGERTVESAFSRRLGRAAMTKSVSGNYALRSLLGHPRRSVLSVFGIGVGCAIGLILLSFFNGAMEMIVRAASESGAGHLRVVPEEWEETRDNTLRLVDWEEALAVVRAEPGVKHVVPRARVNGLLALGNRTAGVELAGVEPEVEFASNRVVARSTITGRYLRPGDSGVAVIGAEVAKRLGVDLDDDLLATLAGRDGMEGAMFRVVGILESGGSEFDATLCHVMLADLAAVSGYESPGEIAIMLDDHNSIDATREALIAKMPPGDTVITWRESNRALSGTMEGKTKGMKFMAFFVLVVVALGITSAQLTAVLQRRREYGLLMALGMKGRHLMGLIMIEATLTGLAGAVVALLLATAPTYLLATKGFNIGWVLGDLSMLGALMDPYWYGDFGPWLIGYALGVSLAATLAAGLYPAWFALKTDPADALRAV